MKIDATARNALRAALKAHPGWTAYRLQHGLDMATITKEQTLSACAALGIDAFRIVQEASGASTAGAGETTTTTARETREDTGRTAACATGLNGSAVYAAAASTVPHVAQAPAQTPAQDPATLLAAALAPVMSALLDRQTVAAIARDEVERALSGVSSLKIELQRAGATVGQIDGHHHPMFPTLCKALAARTAAGYAPNVWIAGPAGSGKTHAAKTFAKAAGLPFHYNGALSMPHELLGFIDAGGTYHRTPFREAYEHGGVYLFDEVDGSDNGALLALNAALANGAASFPDGQIQRHADSVIIATANTWGLGATAEYVGRGKIDAAFLSRFPVRLAWDYDVAMEQAVFGDRAFAERVQAARARAKAAGLKVLIDPRATEAGAALIAAGFTGDEAAALTYLANLSPEQRKIVEGR